MVRLRPNTRATSGGSALVPTSQASAARLGAALAEVLVGLGEVRVGGGLVCDGDAALGGARAEHAGRQRLRRARADLLRQLERAAGLVARGAQIAELQVDLGEQARGLALQ